ncbi:fibronectin type III domain-containing protein [Wenyingzhuangia sp. 2_MG-2023]|uniref:fibronectin type III domain-containing protein n=1 Tax=Wenyingzhuangia sp. 2_MG-2023 TaxID=3062639 RepID=UPI0026E142BC|nr:fibronectin type III domain-containing protein [Wenyingzhuangia sp. 2_MG-2023]MDO6737083.1 fibronectin type III domain-containing protein [Wenyingzhuangia sp. 2_MG-2023]
MYLPELKIKQILDDSDIVLAIDKDGILCGYPISLFQGGIPQDTENPSTPLNFTTSVSNNTQVTASWDEATDNIEVSSYVLEYTLTSDSTWANKQVVSTQNTSSVLNINTSGNYKFRVKSIDSSDNSSSYSTESTESINVPLPASYTMYYGQSATVPDAAAVQLGFSSSITGNTNVNAPFDTEVVHWFAIPNELSIVSAYNSVITADVLYTSESDNDYTKSTITIGGETYSLYAFTSILPLGQDVIINVTTV